MFFMLFGHYWWMIFPLSACAFGIIRVILRQEESRRALALIQTYTDQGKEPPAELLAILRRCND